MPSAKLEVEDAIDAANKSLDRILGFLARVEARTQLMLGIVFGAILLLVLNIPKSLPSFWLVSPGIVTGIMFAMTLERLFASLFPTLDAETPRSSIYFGHIACRKRQDFFDEFRAMNEADYLAQVVDQVWMTSRIVAAKFGALKTAYLWFAFSIPFWACQLGLFIYENNAVVVK